MSELRAPGHQVAPTVKSDSRWKRQKLFKIKAKSPQRGHNPLVWRKVEEEKKKKKAR